MYTIFIFTQISLLIDYIHACVVFSISVFVSLAHIMADMIVFEPQFL